MSPQAPSLRRIRDAIYVAGQWCAVASLFVVTLNKPATNVAVVLSLVFSLLGTNVRQRWLDAARNPFAQGALLWWCVLMASAFHAWYVTSSSPSMNSFVWVCWYPLVLGSLFQSPEWRRRALLAFAAAVSLVLLISYGMDLGLISQRPESLVTPAMHNTVFKEYTQQGLAELILMSMALAIVVVAPSGRVKLVCFLIALLALVNVVFMLESRTAYLVLVPLAFYWAWRFSVKRQLTRRVLFASSALVLVALVVASSTSSVRDRLFFAVPHEVDLYLKQRQPTSAGIRLELWRRTVPIIATAPAFGHGLDQWKPLYRESIKTLPHFEQFDMGHPHQEMLLIASEQGLVGLAIYLCLLLALARRLRHMSQPERDFFNCVLLIYLTAGLANGLWADFTHRHVFVLLLACIPFGRQASPDQIDGEA